MWVKGGVQLDKIFTVAAQQRPFLRLSSTQLLCTISQDLESTASGTVTSIKSKTGPKASPV